ncbi:hypothetical protein [Thiohalorhabdus denitrificans]|uniref:Uncharacterized protein n=1 Tax=Thiohalorhabdus denitrificans TaxID=381306 RepID=A0A1G5EU82_9GAMM|nr:hypothetical protein [Thiohalorhabdus denitrificans]SCY30556.1 hypothetical protein SAMN05661077_1776 [Thiohalorhabdus denitrificans]
MKGEPARLAFMLGCPKRAAADNEEGIVTNMDRAPEAAAIRTRPIRHGDVWEYSVTGFFAGGFRVLPVSGRLTYAALAGAGEVEGLALAYALHLAGGGRSFADRGATYFHQEADRSLVEQGTEADGPLRHGPARYLPGTLYPGYRTQRRLEYESGAAEEGTISVLAARALETGVGELPAFKVEDIRERTEPDGARVKCHDTGWFVPALGFFARGTATIRTYDPRGRFQAFQLLGFELERTSPNR